MIYATVTIYFPNQYVGNPYWPEVFKLIEITKQSGMNRARASQNRDKALEEHLRQTGMTLDQFRKLEEDSKRPFHTNAAGKIIIPSEYIMSFLVAATDEARAASRPCAKEQVRSRFQATDFETQKEAPDGLWERFATVTAGTGAKLSNQRGYRSNNYIKDFEATGTLGFDEQYVKPESVKNLIAWGGQFVGIGASRKMGKGRFVLRQFTTQQVEEDVAA